MAPHGSDSIGVGGLRRSREAVAWVIPVEDAAERLKKSHSDNLLRVSQNHYLKKQRAQGNISGQNTQEEPSSPTATTPTGEKKQICGDASLRLPGWR